MMNRRGMHTPFQSTSYPQAAGREEGEGEEEISLTKGSPLKSGGQSDR